MAAFETLDDLGDVTGKVALVRVDLNLPMKDGSATDVTRVEAVKPTILELSEKGAKAISAQARAIVAVSSRGRASRKGQPSSASSATSLAPSPSRA